MIEIVSVGGSASDLIEGMWKVICWARSVPDEPQPWKLNDRFLEAVAAFFQIQERERLLTLRFLDVTLDATTTTPVLVCHRGRYPLDVLLPTT